MIFGDSEIESPVILLSHLPCDNTFVNILNYGCQVFV